MLSPDGDGISLWDLEREREKGFDYRTSYGIRRFRFQPLRWESWGHSTTGAGTFATAYSLRDQPFVYKVIHASFRASERRDELSAIHALCLSPLASPALFAVTLPHELHDPTTQRAEVLSFPPLPLREDGESPAKF